MRLGDVLRKWRRASDITVRDAAKEIGIGFSTLCRIENGETMDGATLAAILAWLMRQIKSKGNVKPKKKRLRPGAFTSDEPGIGVGWGT